MTNLDSHALKYLETALLEAPILLQLTPLVLSFIYFKYLFKSIIK